MLSLAKHELFRNNFYSKPSFGWNILRIAELIIEPFPNYLVITNNHPSYHTRGHDFTFSPKILPTSQCCCYQYLKINVSNREDFMYGPLGIRYVGYWYKEEREGGRNVWLWTCGEMSVNNNIFGIWILTIYYSKFLTGFISLILGSMKLFWKLSTTRFFTPNCCKHHGETPSISSLYLSSIFFFALLAQIPLKRSS